MSLRVNSSSSLSVPLNQDISASNAYAQISPLIRGLPSATFIPVMERNLLPDSYRQDQEMDRLILEFERHKNPTILHILLKHFEAKLNDAQSRGHYLNRIISYADIANGFPLSPDVFPIFFSIAKAYKQRYELFNATLKEDIEQAILFSEKIEKSHNDLGLFTSIRAENFVWLCHAFLEFYPFLNRAIDIDQIVRYALYPEIQLSLGVDFFCGNDLLRAYSLVNLCGALFLRNAASDNDLITMYAAASRDIFSSKEHSLDLDQKIYYAKSIVYHVASLAKNLLFCDQNIQSALFSERLYKEVQEVYLSQKILFPVADFDLRLVNLSILVCLIYGRNMRREGDPRDAEVVIEIGFYLEMYFSYGGNGEFLRSSFRIENLIQLIWAHREVVATGVSPNLDLNLLVHYAQKAEELSLENKNPSLEDHLLRFKGFIYLGISLAFLKNNLDQSLEKTISYLDKVRRLFFYMEQQKTFLDCPQELDRETKIRFGESLVILSGLLEGKGVSSLSDLSSLISYRNLAKQMFISAGNVYGFEKRLKNKNLDRLSRLREFQRDVYLGRNTTLPE